MAEEERFELSGELLHAWFSRPAQYDRFGIPPYWWTVGESNPRPLQCECNALPTELTAPIFFG